MIDSTRIEFRKQGDEVWHVWSNSTEVQGGVTIEWDPNDKVVAVTIPGDINDYEVQRITHS